MLSHRLRLCRKCGNVSSDPKFVECDFGLLEAKLKAAMAHNVPTTRVTREMRAAEKVKRFCETYGQSKLTLHK